MSLSILEQKLYKSNFKNEEQRLNILVSLHSHLTKHKGVPSFYIAENNLNINSFLNKILFSEINNLIEINSLNLKTLGIPQKYLSTLSSEDRFEILEMIEDVLSNGFGKGHVHYEVLRLSPQNNCPVLEILKSNLQNTIEFAYLIKKLNFRLSEANKYLFQIENIFSSGERNYHPSTISKSYSLLVEKSWKNNWMSHENYIDSNIPSSILILEDL